MFASPEREVKHLFAKDGRFLTLRDRLILTESLTWEMRSGGTEKVVTNGDEKFLQSDKDCDMPTTVDQHFKRENTRVNRKANKKVT